MSQNTLHERTNSDVTPQQTDSGEQFIDQEQTLSKDTVFEILKNQRRRDALLYLRQNGGESTLSDMAEFIAAKENGVSLGQLTSSQRKRVYIGLYQCHLPKMAKAGVVEFDKNRGTIRLRSEADQLDIYLGESGPTGANTTLVAAPIRRNLAIAGGIGAGVLASLLGIPGFAVVPDVGWALLSTGALITLTALEARRTTAE